MGPKTRSSIIILVFTGFTVALAGQTRSTDWPQWRGPNRDGVTASFTEPHVWPEKLIRKWKIDVGLGYASPVVVGNRLYMYTRQQDDEVLTAVDPADGRTIWRTSYPAPFTMHPAAASHEKGSKSTPAFADGKLYTLGMSGIVTAFDAATGKQVWQKPAPPTGPLYGTAMSPLVDRGLVVVHVGGHDKGALTAFSANTGEVKWHWDGDGPGYGSPIVVDFDGTRQVITLTQDHLVGVSIATGELLWQRPYKTPYTQNCITPVLHGRTVIISGLDQGVTAFNVVKRNGNWETVTVWENPDVGLYMTNGVVVRDVFIGLSHKKNGQFFGLDANTGKTIWTSQPRQATNAAITRAGDLLFVLKEDAELLVTKTGPQGFEPLRTYTVAESATWAQPAISGGRVFVKDVSALTLWTPN